MLCLNLCMTQPMQWTSLTKKIQVNKDGTVVYMSEGGFTSKPIQEAVKDKYNLGH